MSFEQFSRRLSKRLVLFSTVIIIVTLTTISLLALQLFERALAPELSRKATAVGESLSRSIGEALALRIPLEQLVGVEPWLQQHLARHPEVLSAQVVTPSQGQVLYGVGAKPALPLVLPSAVRAHQGEAEPVLVSHDAQLTQWVPIHYRQQTVAWLALGLDESYVREQQSAILYDAFTALVICVLLILEILLALTAIALIGPLRRLAQGLVAGAQGNFAWESSPRGEGEVSRLLQALSRLYRRLDALRARQGEAYPIATPVGEELMSATAVLAKRAPQETAVQEEARQAEAAPAAPDFSAIRLPLFLFFFSSELSRAFLPLFAQQLALESPWVEELWGGAVGAGGLAVALPFTLYFLLVMLATPFAGALAARIGHRRLFLVGLVPATLGYVMTAFAGDLLALILWRAVNGIGYATISIAALGYIAARTPAQRRAQGMAVFFSASMIAGLSGSAIGGILADRIGYEPTFILSTLLAMVAAVLAYRLIDDEPSVTASAPRSGGGLLSCWGALLGNGRFIKIVLLSAAPAQIMLTGALFYLTPLYLAHLGNDASVIGRVMMTYFMVVALLAPALSRLTDKNRWHARAVVSGGLLSGLGFLALGVNEGTWMAMGAVLMLALGHVLILTNQLSIMLLATQRQCAEFGQGAVIGFYRLLERAGSAAGPLVVALLLSQVGYRWSAVALGVAALLCGVGFGAMARPRPAEPATTAPLSTPS